MKTGRTAFLLIGLFYILAAGTLSFHFPPVNSDEVSYAVHGVNMLEGKGHRYPLYDDVFAPSVYSLRDATPEITQSLFNGWVGLWIKILGKSIWAARLSSVAAGVLVLCLFYSIGLQLGTPASALCGVGLLVLNPIFLASSAIVRPEMLLLLAGSAIFRLMLRLKTITNWAGYGIGILNGISLSIHHNALLLTAALISYTLLVNRPSHWGKLILCIGLGELSGLIVMMTTYDVFKVYFIQKYFFNTFYRPPVLIYPWHPLQWMASLLNSFVMGRTYYFKTSGIDGWKVSTIFMFSAIAIALAGLALSVYFSKQENTFEKHKKGLLVGFVIVLVGMACKVNKKEALYAMVLFPFAIPAAAFFLVESFSRTRRDLLHRLTGWVCAVFLVGAFVSFSVFSYHYSRQCVPYEQVIQKVRRLIGDSPQKTLGPAVLWFGWPSENFRDLGALIKSRWYTGGNRDILTWISPWKPDIIILDPLTSRIFLGGPANPSLFSSLLKEKVDYLGMVDPSLGNDAMDIYRVHWAN